MNKEQYIGAVLSLVVFLAACNGGTPPNPIAGFTLPEAADFSAQTWTAAFDAMHEKLSHEYAFTDWKGIDWNTLRTQYRTGIARAESVRDEQAYYLALQQYLYSIPDGHIVLHATDPTAKNAVALQQVGGSFGLALAELDDGRVIAAALVPSGPAEQAGMVAGAKVVQWNGKTIKAAIDEVAPRKIAFGSTIATSERYRLEQVRFLTRTTTGATVTVLFRNPGAAFSQAAALTAVADSAFRSLALVDFSPQRSAQDYSEIVTHRILPEGYGYVLLAQEGDPQDPTNAGIRAKFRLAMTDFVAAGVPGVIVDLRGNRGGSDQLAADICGFFYAERSFYEYQSYYDQRTGSFTLTTQDDVTGEMTDEPVWITPQSPYFGGPVIALVNPSDISSGEGPAMCIQRLPQGHVVGFHGTNGSFGIVGITITLPGRYIVLYPFGRSLDQNQQIQLDSRNGIGGVSPDLRVPKTYENVMAHAAGTDVELQFAVRYLRGR